MRAAATGQPAACEKLVKKIPLARRALHGVYQPFNRKLSHGQIQAPGLTMQSLAISCARQLVRKAAAVFVVAKIPRMKLYSFSNGPPMDADFVLQGR